AGGRWPPTTRGRWCRRRADPEPRAQAAAPGAARDGADGIAQIRLEDLHRRGLALGAAQRRPQVLGRQLLERALDTGLRSDGDVANEGARARRGGISGLAFAPSASVATRSRSCRSPTARCSP